MSTIDRASPLSLAIDGPVATVTLARPPVNALDASLTEALDQALAAIEADDRIAALRIRSGERVFCAGADLKQVSAHLANPSGAVDMVRWVEALHQVFDRLAALPALTVAEIEGRRSAAASNWRLPATCASHRSAPLSACTN